MTKTNLKSLAVSLLLATPALQAAPLELGFEEGVFTHGTVANTQYSGITISAENFTHNIIDEAVVFDSTLTGTRDPDLEDPFNGSFRPGNILIIQENDFLMDSGDIISTTGGCADGTCDAPDDEGTRFTNAQNEVVAPTGRIRFDFDFAIELLSLDFFDVETEEDGAEDYNRIDIWDFDTNDITTVGHTPDTGGNNMWMQVLFDSAVHPELLNVGRVDVYFGGSGALDNLTYKVVPIPAAFWLFGTALIGFIGFSRRTTI